MNWVPLVFIYLLPPKISFRDGLCKRRAFDDFLFVESGGSAQTATSDQLNTGTVRRCLQAKMKKSYKIKASIYNSQFLILWSSLILKSKKLKVLNFLKLCAVFHFFSNKSLKISYLSRNFLSFVISSGTCFSSFHFSSFSFHLSLKSGSIKICLELSNFAFLNLNFILNISSFIRFRAKYSHFTSSFSK